MAIKEKFGLFHFINYAVFAIITIICVFPFYYLFINTISDNDLSSRGLVMFFPKGIHWTNYADVFDIPGLGQAALVSVGRTVLGTVLTVAASGFLGYLFTKQMWARKFWYRYLVITMYFNAGLIPWYLTMVNLGLANTFMAYLLPAIVQPFFIILVKTFIESMPLALQESAQIDGAGYFKIFTSIILPLITPILATIAIFSAVNQWNSFTDTLFLVTDQNLFSLQFILYRYMNEATSIAQLMTQSSGSMDMNLANMATPTSIRTTISMVVVLPILLVYPFFQRFFVKGIMIGAVKG